MKKSNQKEVGGGPFQIMRKGPFVWIMLIIWSVGSCLFSLVMPNQVVYYQKGCGKVKGDQQIAASECHCPWPGKFNFCDLQ